MKKSRWTYCAVLLLVVLALTACGGGGNGAGAGKEEKPDAPKPKTQFISIATASIGGSYYPIGVGMSEIFKDKIGGIEAKVEVTGGATENPKLVGSGESDMGFTNANLAYQAYKGEGIFEKAKYDKLRLMFAGVAPGTLHIVAKSGSGITRIPDLKGKKVAVGPQGGGGLGMLPHIFEQFGMTMDDISPFYMSYDEGIEALVDGHVDVATAQAPHPAPAIKTLEGTKVGFNFVEIEDADRSAILKKHPYYNSVDIPAETYGLPAVAKALGSTNVLVINADVDEELVYQMTKAVFENLADLHKVHPSASSISLESAVTDLIPLHPGAERYYKEAGIIK